MARKNLTDVIGGSAQSAQLHPVGSNSKQRPTKYYHNSTKYFKAITPPPTVGKTPALPVVESEQQQSPLQRSSPRNVSTTSQGKTSPNGNSKQYQQVSPRTSPGLLGRHYAGCKFSEPPAPAMLPLPPQHWTLTSSTTVTTTCYQNATPKVGAISTLQQQLCLSQQLKVLLKVQS